MQHANKDTTNYLVIFRNYQKVNEVFYKILITRGIQEHGIKILFLLHTTGFDLLKDYEKKKGETVGE